MILADLQSACLRLKIIAGAGLQPVSTTHYLFGVAPTEINLLMDIEQINTLSSNAQEGKRQRAILAPAQQKYFE